MTADRGEVTQLLQAWAAGNLQAQEALVPLIYRELRRRAGAYLRQERPDHTLQATALVHEAYLRLVEQDRVSWQNRAHFFGLASQMMRRILVDHARQHAAAKRNGVQVSLAEDAAIAEPPNCDLLLLDQALTELAQRQPRHAQVVELRYFGGMSEQEVATLLGLSRRTVTREWQAAREWLYTRMTAGAEDQTARHE
jgi:RNA polymerase sigma factor (TIGR02999 family)